MLYRASEIIGMGGDLFSLKNASGVVVGFSAVSCQTPPGAVPQITPHVVWTPEATPRNKLECSLKFLQWLKDEGNLLVVAEEPNWRFFDHLGKYGVIRPVGKLREYFVDGGDAMLYQGVTNGQGRSVGSR